MVSFTTMFLFKIVVVLSIPETKAVCPTSGIICTTPTSYQVCMTLFGKDTPVGKATECPVGKVCDPDAFFACVDSATTKSPTTTTVITTTTTQAPTTTPEIPPTPPQPSACKKNTDLWKAANCTQYYQCIYVMWWWEVKLKTCPSGNAFNGTACVAIATTSCK